MQRCRLLAGRFLVRKHLVKRQAASVPIVEIDGRTDCRNDRKILGETVRKLKRALPAHADSRQTDPWKENVPSFADVGDDLLTDEGHRCYLGIEFGADGVEPPRSLAMRTYDAESVTFEFCRKMRVTLEGFQAVAVQMDDGSAGM